MADTTAVERAPDADAPSRRTSRRSLLGTAAGLTGVALAAGAWRPVPGVREVAPGSRSFGAGKFGLELEGVAAGFVKSVDGGAISADVVLETAATYFQKKHLGQVKYEEFELQVGFSMSKAVYQWINDSWTGNHTRKSGAVLAADLNGTVRSRREFTDALITETTIPACDGASKEPGYLTLKFAPERIQNKAGAGTLQQTTAAQQKSWLPSNFRFQILGLDASKVSKIDAFTIKQSAAVDPVGELRDGREPGKVQFGDLVVTMAESGASASSFEKWFQTFVIAGNSQEENEKPAVLSFLAANADVLAHIDFFNVGIYRYEDAAAVSNSDTIKKVSASLYFERAEFHLGPPVTGGGGGEVCLLCGT